MDDLIPTVLVCPDNFKNKWDITIEGNETIIWTAKEDDAKIGIIDQHKKQHTFVFKKGSRVIQWIEQDVSFMKCENPTQIEYSDAEKN